MDAPETIDPSSPSEQVWNVPNQLSAARIVLAVGCFFVLSVGWYGAALGLFVAAAATDWLDGYWARRFNQITQLGRILDPFADKLVVCGTFIFLAAIPESRVAPWMAVVVMSRELLVTALRSFVEQAGGDFSAKWVGKWKMVLQCAAIIGSLGMLGLEQTGGAFRATVVVLVWSAVGLTLYSGWIYVRLAAKMMRA
ncbi:MAG: CDP-diacylglycerol--glycerol-3-phosphate 3-phosphatidyltransferase [Planctomycetota bacterium]